MAEVPLICAEQPLLPDQLRVKQFDEKEEATVIDSLSMLTFSRAKSYALFPFLSLITVFVYPICVFWYPSLQRSAFYKQ